MSCLFKNIDNMISEHISYAESIHSDAAIRAGLNNYFTQKQLATMKVTAEKIYEPLISHFGVPIYVSSFFRTKELNILIGGSSSSQHCLGEAIDMDASFYGRITNKQIFDYIKYNLEFDQLIWEKGTDIEPGWVHCSYRTRKPNRKQILRNV